MVNIKDAAGYAEFRKSETWQKIRMKRFQIDAFQCQLCGTFATSENWLECHHLDYRAESWEQVDIYRSLVTVCHSCHKRLHHLLNRVISEDGRRGWGGIEAAKVFETEQAELQRRIYSS